VVSTFLVQGPHKLLHNIPRAGRFTYCDFFGICYILPNQQVFVEISFFIIDKVSSRAGFDPWAVVWRLLGQKTME